MRLVLASNNTGKLRELQTLFAPLALSLIAQSELQTPEIDEPFNTFIENALRKARHCAAHTGLPALADDAGLCIDAWDGKPGVHTADFCTTMGLPKSNENQVNAILQAMENVANRRATMVSCLVAMRHAEDPEPLIAIGRVSGLITQERIGAGGFGLDPIFWLPQYEMSFAQMPVDEKNARSHRGIAAAQMHGLLQSHWGVVPTSSPVVQSL